MADPAADPTAPCADLENIGVKKEGKPQNNHLLPVLKQETLTKESVHNPLVGPQKRETLIEGSLNTSGEDIFAQNLEDSSTQASNFLDPIFGDILQQLENEPDHIPNSPTNTSLLSSYIRSEAAIDNSQNEATILPDTTRVGGGKQVHPIVVSHTPGSDTRVEVVYPTTTLKKFAKLCLEFNHATDLSSRASAPPEARLDSDARGMDPALGRKRARSIGSITSDDVQRLEKKPFKPSTCDLVANSITASAGQVETSRTTETWVCHTSSSNSDSVTEPMEAVPHEQTEPSTAYGHSLEKRLVSFGPIRPLAGSSDAANTLDGEDALIQPDREEYKSSSNNNGSDSAPSEAFSQEPRELSKGHDQGIDSTRQIQREKSTDIEELHNHSSGIKETFLETFTNFGLNTDPASSSSESLMTRAMAEGMASIVEFVNEVHKQAEASEAGHKAQIEVLTNEILRLTQLEARHDVLAADYAKFQRRGTQKDIKAELDRIEIKIDKLRAPDVTLEKIHEKITSFEGQLAKMDQSIDKFKEGCDKEKARLRTARIELTNGFKSRKRDLKDIEKELGELREDIKEVKDNLMNDSKMENEGGADEEMMKLKEKLAAETKEEFAQAQKKWDQTQDDLNVLRDHIHHWMLRNENSPSQGLFSPSSNHQVPNDADTNSIQQIEDQLTLMKQKYDRFFDETRDTSLAVDSKLISLWNQVSTLEGRIRIPNPRHTDIDDHGSSEPNNRTLGLELKRLKENHEELKKDSSKFRFLFQETIAGQLGDYNKKFNEFTRALTDEATERMRTNTAVRNVVTSLRAICNKNFTATIPTKARQECLDYEKVMDFWSAEFERCLEQDSNSMVLKLNDLYKRMNKGEALSKCYKDYSLDTDSVRDIHPMLTRCMNYWRMKNQATQEGSV